MTDKQKVLNVARSIRGKRIIASMDYVEMDEDYVRGVAKRYGLKYLIFRGQDWAYPEIVFYRPGAESYAQHYKKSQEQIGETTDETSSGLTPQEHYDLGLAFGYDPEEAEEFRGIMEGHLVKKRGSTE